MLIVRIYVNSEEIGIETALRIKGGTKPNDMNTYELSDGSTILHRYGDGAACLAEAMMNHLASKEKENRSLSNFKSLKGFKK
jgi:hypothetical protein